jgi:hypothetical protein
MLTPSTDGRRVLSRGLLGAIALILVWTGAVWVSGGIDWSVAGVRVRSRGPLRPALAAVGVALLYAMAWRRHLPGDVDWFARQGARRAGLLAVALALAVGATAWSTTSVVAGGADAYGYVSQAYLWVSGTLTVPQPLVQQAPWPHADLSYTPLGYRPAIGGGALVPTYAPGLPLLMALGVLVAGDCGPFLIVPLLGGLSVWLTYRLGRELWSPWCGLGAALLLAASPTVAYMLMWPMSDVPAMACWLAATTSAIAGGRWRFLRTGLLIAVAIVVRPNLVVLVLPFVWWAIRTPLDRRTRLVQLLSLIAGVLPGVIVVSIVHTHLYGAPWRSGYGAVETLYAWRHLPLNLVRYPRWLLEIETPFVVGMLVPIAAALRHLWSERRLDEPHARVVLLVLVVAAVWASYLFYVPFDEWWYLRFLLPAWPLTLVLAVQGWAQLAGSRPRLGTLSTVGKGIAVTATLACAVHGAARIAGERMFEIGEGDLAYVRVAQFVVDRLPPNAMLLSMQHSGTLRYYAGRPTLRYDWVARDWWPRALDVLVAQGFQPFFVVSEFEEPLVRARLPAPKPGEDVMGCLVAKEVRAEGVRIYDPRRAHCGPLRIEPEVRNPCRRPATMTPLAGGRAALLEQRQ